MRHNVEWWDVGEEEGVLELPAGRTGDALELHIVIDAETGRTIAWWESERGVWLIAIDAGLA